MALDGSPPWEQRFLAPDLSLPDWAPGFAHRLVLATTESGVWQLHAWDRAAGARRQVTDHPVGVSTGTPTLDGTGILWFQDETGDESGRWFHQPFDGGPSRPFLQDLPAGWNEGVAQANAVVAAGISDRHGIGTHAAVAGSAPTTGGPPVRRSCWPSSTRGGTASTGSTSRPDGPPRSPRPREP